MTQENDILIVTDSNSGITPQEAEILNIGLVPMPFMIDGKEYTENMSLSRPEFLALLKEGKNICTSQPPVGELMELFEEELKAHGHIIYIPMSSALSGSCMTAKCLSSAFGQKVTVVDNLRISCTQKQSVLEAVQLSKAGYTPEKICSLLEEHKNKASVYIAVNSIDYLKKGGRITKYAEAAVTGLNLKPVLQIQGEKLDYFCRARGMKSAQKKILEAIAYDMTHRFFGKDVVIKGAFSEESKESEEWLRSLRDYFPAHLISADPLPFSVCCHTGPDALAAVCMEKLPEAPFIEYEIQKNAPGY